MIIITITYLLPRQKMHCYCSSSKASRILIKFFIISMFGERRRTLLRAHEVGVRAGSGTPWAGG